MKNKVEVSCPNCEQKILIPIGKHIKFVCPNCSNELEVDSRVKESESSSSYSWFYLLLIGGVLYFGYKYFIKKESPPVPEQISSTQKDQIQNNEKFNSNLKLLISAVDVSNETTNDFAVRLASRFPGNYNIGQVCQIFDFIVKNWKYVNDSDKMENIRSASRTIKNNLSGDCDDFAILMAAMIESIGGDARISFAHNGKSGHAFTEVLATQDIESMQNIAKSINDLYRTNKFLIYYKQEKDGSCWLNLDWFGLPQHPGGKYFNYSERTIYYPTLKNPTFIHEKQ